MHVVQKGRKGKLQLQDGLFLQESKADASQEE